MLLLFILYLNRAILLQGKLAVQSVHNHCIAIRLKINHYNYKAGGFCDGGRKSLAEVAENVNLVKRQGCDASF